MIDNPTSLINFLEKNEINIEQFLLCYLHYLDDKRSGLKKISQMKRPLALVFRYAYNVNQFSKEDIDDLIEKGFIENKTKDKYHPDTLIVTDKFADAIMASEENFEEFWDEYPWKTKNFDDPERGPAVSLKAIDKDEVRAIFNKRCKSKQTFEEIMHGLRVAKSKGEINMRVDRWLGAEYWKAYQDEELIEEEYSSRTIV